MHESWLDLLLQAFHSIMLAVLQDFNVGFTVCNLGEKAEKLYQSDFDSKSSTRLL